MPDAIEYESNVEKSHIGKNFKAVLMKAFGKTNWLFTICGVVCGFGYV